MNVTDNCRTDLPRKTRARMDGMPYLRTIASRLVPSRPPKDVDAVYRATDVGIAVMAEVFDTLADEVAQLGLSERDTLTLAQYVARVAVQTYAAQLQADALRGGLAEIAAAIRETAPELAGAVSEAGTDIGAGLLAAFSTLAPGCEPATA